MWKSYNNNPKSPPSTQTRRQTIVFVMSQTIHVTSLSDGRKQMIWSGNHQIASCFTLQSTQDNRRQKSSMAFYCMASFMYGVFSLSDCVNPSRTFVMWDAAAQSRWRHSFAYFPWLVDDEEQIVSKLISGILSMDQWWDNCNSPWDASHNYLINRDQYRFR